MKKEIYLRKMHVVLLIFLVFMTVLSLVDATSAHSQQHGMGMDFDDAAYSELKITATLTRGEYENLPSSVSLKKYAPTPGDQGQTGTCVAWSTGYHARTILESISEARTSKSRTNLNTFSPSYIYNQIRQDNTCANGTRIDSALELLADQGVPKYSLFGFDCNRYPSNEIRLKARQYKIAGYKVLHSSDSNNKILPVKKALAEKKPVIFGMICPPSFSEAKELWKPKRTDYDSGQWEGFGGHALVVVGYDDNKYEGAFQIINSWGTNWGVGGFTWISYKNFNVFTKYSFEIIGQPPLVVDLSGGLRFIKSDGTKMFTKYDENNSIYRMTQPYISGTKFRLYVANNEPAYVYAFGSDATRNIFQIFPYKKNISPYLGYRSNVIAIPDEDHYIRLDKTIGTDYFCVLYSKVSLNIKNILSEIEKNHGSFKDRVESAINTFRIHANRIEHSKEGDISFKAKSGDKTVIPIIVKFEHI